MNDTGGIENLVRRHLENPFLVLALPPEASSAEIERQGQKLLAMLAAELGEAARYGTPAGDQARTPDLVRAAMAGGGEGGGGVGGGWWAGGWRVAACPRIDGHAAYADPTP